MIFLKRKRLIFWLFKAYLRKWGKIISLSFIIGFLLIFLIYLNRSFIVSRVPSSQNISIGIAGEYFSQDLPNNLPDVILSQMSRGLTKVDSEGKILPDLAKNWEIKDDGKTYVFYLVPNIYFSDKKPFDSSSINYNFADVTIERPAKHVIVFKLKDKYSPFLVTLSDQLIFKKNYIGVSDYKIKKIKTDGDYVDFIELSSKKNSNVIKYDFYPTQEALKSAYVLGEVDKIVDINDTNYKDRIDLSKFKNTTTEKVINNEKLVTIFFNNQDPLLSDKKMRKALAFSLPENFKEGKRNYLPYPSSFWVSGENEEFVKDLEYAKLQLEQSSASESGKVTITLSVLPQYKTLAKDISKHWKNLGINTKIETVDGVPTNYQAFLGEFPIIKDPDQYTLWHTGQPGNITRYKNLRIDKLLEDGRRIYDTEERRKIYEDFQKYLLDDMPAIFLFFPYTYTLTRK